MEIKKIWAVYFSPVGNTKKIITAMAETIGRTLEVSVETLDYTLPAARTKEHAFTNTDLVLWGTPVYAGRMPNKLLSYGQDCFKGNGALAVPVAVFGNRNFDDALIELRNMLENNGFHTIAGAGFIAQHAFSQTLAAGRPDQGDMEKLKQFSNQIAEKVKELKTYTPPIEVRGTNPPEIYYTPKGLDGKPTVFLKAKPKTDLAKCNQCGICVQACPMGAIAAENPSEIIGTCIKCHACIKKCEKKAKYFDDEAFLSHQLMLERDFTQRAEPELFI
ncbi:EFR1 family ferrodoxin [Clostridium aminobutyricum]|uniref:EFR1 family ferrodoxin n=1 Tax=Clostridium aminobutyricum TaxID=33953 RepID=A0A939D7D8_CLOAM|nr:EFR1 family ferrodoxin [Clostridium aminobutyricum]MBN7772462.1 EFR1 family ferrodoxin [Clostridium aminobutyricum]